MIIESGETEETDGGKEEGGNSAGNIIIRLIVVSHCINISVQLLSSS